MAQAIGWLATQQASANQAEIERRSMNRERRFGMKREIPKAAATGVLELVDELGNFETEFLKTTPQGGKDWAHAFDEALAGRAKTWRDAEALYLPGSIYYGNCIRPECTDQE